MLDADDTHFTLLETGEITYQPLTGNPLPGTPIAVLAKGGDIYSPELALKEEAEPLKGVEPVAAESRLKSWLGTHINTVLEPLTALHATASEESFPASSRPIATAVYESLGVVPREDLSEETKELVADARRALRQKGVRLGPVLVFMPALGKPAAIRLRALLWALWNDRTLPVTLPRDGSVTEQLTEKEVDRPLYQAVGYPVFGPRAIRADMLDRIVCEIYDSSAEGTFRAQHKMAEWMGCTIEELYDVLEALGHKKIEDAPAPETEAAVPVEEVAAAAQQAEVPSEKQESENAEEVKIAPQEKPLLALFRLKRGSAIKQPRRKPDHKKNVNAPNEQKAKAQKRRPAAKKSSKPSAPRDYSAPAEQRPEDSPFAVLESLKQEKKG